MSGNLNSETGSMTSILEQLGWESLTRDAKVVNSYCYKFKGLKGRAGIPCDDLQLPYRRSRNKHPVAFQVPYARTDIL